MSSRLCLSYSSGSRIVYIVFFFCFRLCVGVSLAVLHTIIWFQVFLSNTNNLHTIIWFQVFLFNTNNFHIIVWFQVFLPKTNNLLAQLAGAVEYTNCNSTEE